VRRLGGLAGDYLRVMGLAGGYMKVLGVGFLSVVECWIGDVGSERLMYGGQMQWVVESGQCDVGAWQKLWKMEGGYTRMTIYSTVWGWCRLEQQGCPFNG
jgi:hypothetical protein